jgi:hypothetical protein
LPWRLWWSFGNYSLLCKFPPIAIKLCRNHFARRKGMKTQDEHVNLQMNLSLLDVSATNMPLDKQKELALALMELLINAATEPTEPQGNGDYDEPETHS